MDMGVSVIIPVYNGEKSIGKALDSLLNQTCKHFEVVIINDGSTDRTEHIVREYPGRGLTIRYAFQDNMGVAMARNRGLDLAKGQYVCFLDSDDFYEQRFMERMLRQISSTGSDVCYCGYKVVTPNRVRNRRTQFTEKRVLLKYVLGKVAVQTTGWMLRSDLIAGHSLRFPPGISCGEDFEFFCESLALARKTTFLKEYLTNYRYGFFPNRLSAFSLDKLDKGFDTIQRLQANPRVNMVPKVEKALVDYRLPAILTYRLMQAINRGVDRDDVLGYYRKYERYLGVFTWNNNLRSIKLNASKIRLRRHLRVG
ncbi:MAG: glycosyltransferase family 2 protein [Limnochordia bacterium]|jgi:glycosyltransferase involved in cell wall biosynthesis